MSANNNTVCISKYLCVFVNFSYNGVHVLYFHLILPHKRSHVINL